MGTLFPKPITGERLTLEKVRTEWTIAARTPIETKGSLQAYTGKELDSLDILRRDMGLLEVFCDDKLVVGIAGSPNKKGDIIFYNGGRWELIKELPEQNDLIPHYNYLAQYVGAL